jgi:UDP-N-acetylmuramyl pentapeptide phosphotransferase/UDP-N-acetylglucosamine-1-phosphate transferase
MHRTGLALLCLGLAAASAAFLWWDISRTNRPTVFDPTA